MWVRSLDQEDLLEVGMATHSSILAWRLPRTYEHGGLQSIGSQKSWTRLKQLSTHTRLFKSLLEVARVTPFYTLFPKTSPSRNFYLSPTSP